jgi:major membrane immunogen (membrane-anchored lipoprotein)
MKAKYLYVIALSGLLTACSTSDSETLKRARTIQDQTLQEYSSLDSTLNARLSALSGEMATISTDSTFATDSTKIQAFEVLKSKQIQVESLQQEFKSWKDQLTLLPSTDAIAKGAANPFGDKANDQQVLEALKKSQEDISTWRSKVNEVK